MASKNQNYLLFSASMVFSRQKQNKTGKQKSKLINLWRFSKLQTVFQRSNVLWRHLGVTPMDWLNRLSPLLYMCVLGFYTKQSFVCLYSSLLVSDGLLTKLAVHLTPLILFVWDKSFSKLSKLIWNLRSSCQNARITGILYYTYHDDYLSIKQIHDCYITILLVLIYPLLFHPKLFHCLGIPFPTKF